MNPSHPLGPQLLNRRPTNQSTKSENELLSKRKVPNENYLKISHSRSCFPPKCFCMIIKGFGDFYAFTTIKPFIVVQYLYSGPKRPIAEIKFWLS